MKRFYKAFLAVAVGVITLCLPACTQFDASDIQSQLDALNARLSKLEEKVDKMNTNIGSLESLVAALKNNDCVVSYTTLPDNAGYKLVFASGKEITLYNGTNGKDGTTPQISVKQDSDGEWYWTLNGEWLLADGKKVKASGHDGADGKDGTNGKDGMTPQLKIVDGYWYISYDGSDWTRLDKATGEDGISVIKSITVKDGYVIIVLNDDEDTRIALPLGNKAVVTGETADITEQSVSITGWGYFKDEEGAQIVYGIEYATQNLNADHQRVYAEGKDEQGKFTCAIEDLLPNTKYYYRAIAYNGVWNYGEVKSFTTKDITVTVTTLEATDIKDGDAILHGEVSINSIKPLTAYGSFILSDSKEDLESRIAKGTYNFYDLSIENGEFQQSYSALKSNTTYYYVACVKVSEKKYYGQICSFVTPYYIVLDGNFDDWETTPTVVSATLPDNSTYPNLLELKAYSNSIYLFFYLEYKIADGQTTAGLEIVLDTDINPHTGFVDWLWNKDGCGWDFMLDSPSGFINGNSIKQLSDVDIYYSSVYLKSGEQIEAWDESAVMTRVKSGIHLQTRGTITDGVARLEFSFPRFYISDLSKYQYCSIGMTVTDIRNNSWNTNGVLPQDEQGLGHASLLEVPLK